MMLSPDVAETILTDSFSNHVRLKHIYYVVNIIEKFFNNDAEGRHTYFAKSVVYSIAPKKPTDI